METKKEVAKGVIINQIREITGCDLEEAEYMYKAETKSNTIVLCIFLFVLCAGMYTVALYL